jgi:hypothetical protein
MSNRDLVQKLTEEGKSAKQISEMTGLSIGGVRYHRSERRRQSNKDRITKYRKRTKTQAIEYKGGKCKRCNYDRCVDALVFHHLDPQEKEFKIGSGNTWGWERIKKELDKTVLLCNRCHSELHAGLWNNVRS